MQRSEPPPYSIVIPFYNEESNVAELIQEIHLAMEPYESYEIIAVNDGSSDETLKKLTQAMESSDVLRVVTHTTNKGQSAAICLGIDTARGNWIITIDGDGQNDPADIPALLKLIEADSREFTPDLICGNRQDRRDTWVRRLSSRVANNVRSSLLGDDTPDTGCGLKIIRRSSFINLPRFDHMHRFLPALIRRDGGLTISVAVSHRPRIRGESKYGIGNRLGVGLIDLVGMLWLKRRAFKKSSITEELLP